MSGHEDDIPTGALADILGATNITLTRRDALIGGVSIVAATAAALSPLRYAESMPSMSEFMHKYYRELTPADKEQLIAHLTEKVKEQYGADAHFTDPQAEPGVQFAAMLNLEKCIGCRRCVHACAKENNLSRDPEIQYIRVVRMNRGTLSVEQSEHAYEDQLVPNPEHYYMPISCQQCARPACVKVCPVEATWQEADGIVVIDYDWCIGCRYCEAACPYWSRRFNFQEPLVPQKDFNPNMGLLSNRPRPVGVVEKCHFCLHRTRAGRYPACVEVCPVGARKFGNVLDPDSEVAYILKNKRVYRLKEELNSGSRFYYFFD